MLESDVEENGQFSIKVKIGSAEIAVSAPDRNFVVDESNRLIEQFKLNALDRTSTQIEVVEGEVTAVPEISHTRAIKPETLGEFYRRFSIQTHLEKILLLGYWCEIKQHQPHFTSEDIQAKYKEVKEPPPANIRRDLGSLVSKGLLLPPGKADDGALTYALSNSGIKDVESKMPPA